MTDHYWRRLEQVARAEAAATFSPERDEAGPILLDRILAAVPPPAGISTADVWERARPVLMDALIEALREQADGMQVSVDE